MLHIFVTLFFANKSLNKLAGVLEHCCEVETNSWFSIFYALPSNRIPKARKDVIVHFFIDNSSSCTLFNWKGYVVKHNYVN